MSSEEFSLPDKRKRRMCKEGCRPPLLCFRAKTINRPATLNGRPLATAEIFPGGQRQHFADPCQVANDVMQMYVHETFYHFYTTTPQRKCPFYYNSHKTALCWQL